MGMYLLLTSSLFIIITTLDQMQCDGYVNTGRKGYSPNKDQCQVEVGRQCGGETITFSATIKSPNSGCNNEKPVPTEYIHLPGHGYYKYHSTPKAWNDARLVCRNEGAHLVVLNSEVEAKFIASLPHNKYDWALIGMHDLYKEGQWVTIFDEELYTAGYNKWYDGEPTNLTSDENCGVVFPNGLIADFLCHDPRTFFCEIN